MGSLRQRLILQEDSSIDKMFVMIADAQALTDNADNPEKIRQNIIEVALDYPFSWSRPRKMYTVHTESDTRNIGTNYFLHEFNKC